MVFIHSVLRFHNILEPKILTFLKQTRKDLSQKRKVECKRKKKQIFFVAFNKLKRERKESTRGFINNLEFEMTRSRNEWTCADCVFKTPKNKKIDFITAKRLRN